MASLIIRGKSYAVKLSPNENIKRPIITIGKALGRRRKKGDTGYTEQEAITFKVNIENLILFSSKNQPLNDTLEEWIANLSDAHRARLETLNLIESKEKPQDYTVIEWVAKYIELKKQNKALKPNTIKKYYTTQSKIKAFFRTEKLSDVTKELACNFRYYLQNVCGLAENSIRKDIRLTSEMFKYAVEIGMIEKNPFNKQKIATIANPERSFYITPEIAQKVLDACPDTEWKLIFALARFGGLRTPSETFRLKWEDVHFETETFTVHASKTEHHDNNGIRTVPMFPELRELFLKAFEEAEPGSEHVINKNSKGDNLRTQLTRIIKRAGLEPWPKLFQNCRSTRETELCKMTEGNIKAVCSWIGNSPEIAMKHYIQVTDADMRDAAKMSVLKDAEITVHTSTHKCIHKCIHTGAERPCKELQEEEAKEAKEAVSSIVCKSLHKKSGSLQDVAKSRLIAPRRIELLFPG